MNSIQNVKNIFELVPKDICKEIASYLNHRTGKGMLRVSKEFKVIAAVFYVRLWNVEDVEQGLNLPMIERP